MSVSSGAGLPSVPLADAWLGFATDALERPLVRWPDDDACRLLVETFSVLGCHLNMSTDPAVAISRMWPPAHYAPFEAEIRVWAHEHAPRRHPLLRFYRATGVPRCLPVSAVPDEFADARTVGGWRDLARAWGGVRDQLAVPLVFGPHGHRAFVLDGAAEFSAAEVATAARLQRLLVGVDRHVHLHGVAAGRTGVDPWEAIRFTPRETIVLDLLAQSLTAATIGRRMAISERTVQKHLQNIYGKLGVSDRLGAVLRAEQIGFIRT